MKLFGNKTIDERYTSELLQKDVTVFIGILKSKMKASFTDIELLTKSIELIDKIFNNHISYVMDIADLNILQDANENDPSWKKFQVSNIEDFAWIINKNIKDNLKWASVENQHLFNNVLSDTYFEYIEKKRIHLIKIEEKKNFRYNYNFFTSLNYIKSLHSNISIQSHLDFKQVMNEFDKIHTRDKVWGSLAWIINKHLLDFVSKKSPLLAKLEDGQISEKDYKEEMSKILTPEVFCSSTFNARNMINVINNDYIYQRSSENPKNQLSIEACLSNRYFPVVLHKVEVSVPWVEEKKEINNLVIITTLETVLNRFKWNIWNRKDEIGYSRSHFGNFIESYDDDQLFKEYLILPEDEFMKFYEYINQNDEFFTEILDENRKARHKALEDDTIGTWEAKKEFDEIVVKAINNKATDIYMKPYDWMWLVNIRTKESVVKKLQTISNDMHTKIISMLVDDTKQDQFKIVVPVDGEQEREVTDLKTQKKYKVSLRFSFPQGKWSTRDRVYVRIWHIQTDEREEKRLDLESIWYKPENLKTIDSAIVNNKNGLILVTWPTGSGKTTLLYWLLEKHVLSRPDIHLLTAEDPIERKLRFPNAEQNTITKAADAKTLLKSFLRQDPDWILIGETRDRELLEQLTQASYTWHLSFSTLHTNNTKETLDRLQALYSDWKVENYEEARRTLLWIIRLIVSVILVPKLCDNCKIEVNSDVVRERMLLKWLSEDTINNHLSEDDKYYSPNLKWCKQCEAWFNGRQVITEIMNLTDDEIMSRVLDKDYSTIQTLFKEWMHYVKNGIIDIDTLCRNASK